MLMIRVTACLGIACLVLRYANPRKYNKGYITAIYLVSVQVDSPIAAYWLGIYSVQVVGQNSLCNIPKQKLFIGRES